MRINAAEGNLDKQGLFTINDDGKISANATEKEKSGRNVYAGNMTIDLNFESKLAQKRKQAQNQAMKFVSEAFDKDMLNADLRDKLNKLHKDKVSEMKEYEAEIGDLENQKEELRKQYGVQPDSQEQKDLELLQKYQDRINGTSFDRFSEAELERLKELQNEPRTEYQTRVLEMNQRQGVLKQKADEVMQEVKGLSQSITDAGIEEEKNQGMIKAQDVAEELLDAAEKEIFGMLVEQGKDNIDETAKEEQEKADELEEKNEEREERIEEQREDRKEQEEILKGIAQEEKITQKLGDFEPVNNSIEIAQKNIQKLVKENNILDDDLKGIEIDFGF